MTVIRIDGHPREEELANYVGDLLTPAEAEQVEAHVVACAVCARRLQRAASFQLTLHEAAASLEGEVVAPARRPAWLRRHLGAVAASWAGAAAVLLAVWQPGGGMAIEAEAHGPVIVAAASEPRRSEPSVTGCDPADPRCADGLLASVDPLQSVDPLSSWPDDAFFAGAGWAEDKEGVPCGSGEDGGPLVCKPSAS
jgi:hypothetical protein